MDLGFVPGTVSITFLTLFHSVFSITEQEKNPLLSAQMREL
jgi:hypothetical protein